MALTPQRSSVLHRPSNGSSKMRFGASATSTALALSLISCTGFASIRSAQVVPGNSFLVQAGASAPPGDLPGWMWSFDCADDCNHVIPGFEIGYGRGVVDSSRAWSFEGGLSLPLTPYVEVYRQVGTRSRPRGIGIRVGAPLSDGGEPREYRIFYRTDPRPNLTSNTHLLVAAGRSPNGENSATFIALIQSVGWLSYGPTSGFISALSFGPTHTFRNRHGERESATRLLATISFTARLH